MYKILIVEDDAVIASAIAKQTAAWGYTPYCVSDFQNVLTEFGQVDPQLVLLDITLPFFNGYHWCREIRKISKVPVIFISSAAENMNIVMAISMGADDFITKPFGMMEFLARIKAVLKRSKKQEQPKEYHCRGLTVDVKSRKVWDEDRSVDLTLKEFELLRYLLENRGTVLSREKILEKIWGYEIYGETRTVDVHIRTLRQKLGDSGSLIETVRGVGYRIGEET